MEALLPALVAEAVCFRLTAMSAWAPMRMPRHSRLGVYMLATIALGHGSALPERRSLQAAPGIGNQQQRHADVEHRAFLPAMAQQARERSKQPQRHTPRRTDSVWMAETRSPLTSGMSLKKAMTMEKTAMKVQAKASGKVITGSLLQLVSPGLLPHGGGSAPEQHRGRHVEVKAELHRQRPHAKDAGGGKDRGALPAHERQVSGVHDAQAQAESGSQCRRMCGLAAAYLSASVSSRGCEFEATPGGV